MNGDETVSSKELENVVAKEFYSKIFEKPREEKNVDNQFVLKNGAIVSKKSTVNWANKDSYTDAMNRNKIDGEGTLSLAAPNTKYTGNLLNGIYEGEGILEYRENKIEAIFQNGYPTGESRIQFSDGGSFIGKLNDHGRMISGERKYSNGLFIGSFDGEQKRRRGVYVLSDHAVLGLFKDGKLHGICQVLWHLKDSLSLKTRSLEEFCGDFFQGQKHGLGMLKWNGMILLSMYKDNQKHGSGLLMAPNGDFIVGDPMFVNDRYCRSRKIQLNRQNFPIIEELFRSKGRLSSKKFRIQIQNMLKDSLEFGDDFPFHFPDFSVDVAFTPIISFLEENFFDEKIAPNLELSSIRQVIINEYFKLKDIYQRYACFSTEEDSLNSNFVMNRLGLWQFFRDIGLKDSGEVFSFFIHENKVPTLVDYIISFLSPADISIPVILQRAEIEFHILVLNPNDFSEPVEFHAFLKYLLYLTLLLNESQKNIEAAKKVGCRDFFGRFATMVLIFLKNVVYKAVLFSKGPLAERILKEDPSICRCYTWCSRIKEPFSIRTLFKIVEILKGEKELENFLEVDINMVSSRDNLEILKNVFSQVGVKDVSVLLRETFTQCFDSDGTVTSIEYLIDGIDMVQIFEGVLKIGIKKFKVANRVELKSDIAI